MYMDSPLAKFTKNDGILSLMHCEEWNFLSRVQSGMSRVKVDSPWWLD